MDVKGVMNRVAELLADPRKTWATLDNFTGTVNQCYQDLFQKLADTDFPFDEQEVELPGVPIGTVDLSGYSTPGNPLEKLAFPTKLWWKQAGVDPTNYTEVPDVDELPDVSNTQGITAWKFSGGMIKVTPSTIAIDVRVEGEFAFPELASPDDPIRMANVNNVLGYMIASTIGLIRGNDKWHEGYKEAADEQLDTIARKMVKNAQQTVRRVQRVTRRARSRRRLHMH